MSKGIWDAELWGVFVSTEKDPECRSVVLLESGKIWVAGLSKCLSADDPFIADREWIRLEPEPALGEPLKGDSLPPGHYIRWHGATGHVSVFTVCQGGMSQWAGYDYWPLTLPPLPEQKPKLPEPPKFKCVVRKKDGPGDTLFVTQWGGEILGLGGVIKTGQYRWLKIDEAELVDCPGITPDPELVALFSEGGAS